MLPNALTMLLISLAVMRVLVWVAVRSCVSAAARAAFTSAVQRADCYRRPRLFGGDAALTTHDRAGHPPPRWCCSCGRRCGCRLMVRRPARNARSAVRDTRDQRYERELVMNVVHESAP